jgi:cytidine deaminase
MRFHFNDKIYADLMRRRNDFVSGMSRRDNIDMFRHIAAVIGKSGEIISIGYNNVRPNRFSTIHAERDALDKAIGTFYRKYGRSSLQKETPKVDLVVMRDNGNNSRPCYNCITEVLNGNQYFNINRIFYSHDQAIGGLVETTPRELFRGRYKHVSRFNARRMGLDAPDALAWMAYDNSCADPMNVMDDDGHDHHAHGDDCGCADENGDDADGEGKARILNVECFC